MGRYYRGDIEGKFWFGVQDSRDAEHFGGKETPIIEIFEDEDGNKSTDHQTHPFIYPCGQEYGYACDCKDIFLFAGCRDN